MSAFCEDPAKLLAFKRNEFTGFPTQRQLPLQCLEWPSVQSDKGHYLETPSAATLLLRVAAKPCRLRIITTPLNPTSQEEGEEFEKLFTHYSLPPAILRDSQSVAYAYGTRKAPGNDADVVWTQFLCRDFYLHEQTRTNLRNHARYMWLSATFFLHIKSSVSNPREAETVTLLCFAPPQPLADRLARLLENDAWIDVCREPYLLFDIIQDELFAVLDSIAWRLARLFRPAERALIERANSRADDGSIDFKDLHAVVTNCIFLIENTEASLATLDAMIASLKAKRGSKPTTLASAAIEALEYRRLNFHSTFLRLQALEKRMSNVIGLSFNLVTQRDSRVMQNDSRAMKAIALLTLIFLPATALASIFSTPFFDADFDTRKQNLHVSTSFWIFWVVTLPLTAIIVLLWLWWYKKPANHVRAERPWPMLRLRSFARPEAAHTKAREI